MKVPKIVSLISSYNPKNLYIGKVIEELKKISSVYLFTTEEHEYDVEQTFYFPKSIGVNLVYKPREWIANNIDQDWDFVLYDEDDILIPVESIKNVVDLYCKLPENLIPGFIRYECLDENNRRYIDVHPSNSVHMGGNTIIKSVIKNHELWQPWNLHSGNFLFSKNHIKQTIKNRKFETYFREFGLQYGSCLELESAASVLYYDYVKVYTKDVNLVSCHHMPNKYISMPHIYGDGCGPGKEEILKEYERL